MAQELVDDDGGQSRRALLDGQTAVELDRGDQAQELPPRAGARGISRRSVGELAAGTAAAAAAAWLGDEHGKAVTHEAVTEQAFQEGYASGHEAGRTQGEVTGIENALFAAEWARCKAWELNARGRLDDVPFLNGAVVQYGGTESNDIQYDFLLLAPLPGEPEENMPDDFDGKLAYLQNRILYYQQPRIGAGGVRTIELAPLRFDGEAMRFMVFGGTPIRRESLVVNKGGDGGVREIGVAYIPGIDGHPVPPAFPTILDSRTPIPSQTGAQSKGG